MVRLDRTIQKRLRSLEKGFSIYRLEPILDPPVKPEDDDRRKSVELFKRGRVLKVNESIEK
jgi:hypothetical protein